jgi:hypothetical protein
VSKKKKRKKATRDEARDARREVLRESKQEARRLREAAQAHARLVRETKDQLLMSLTPYICAHYGDPATGRNGELMTAYVAACLSSAATLRALLMQKDDAT